MRLRRRRWYGRKWRRDIIDIIVDTTPDKINIHFHLSAELRNVLINLREPVLGSV